VVAVLGKKLRWPWRAKGADVVVSGRQRDVLEKTAAEIQALGRRAVVAIADVTSESQVSEMFDSAIQAFGRVDIPR
jgi:citronellol/citronellal dehydrogenase